jgi:hypothetical protein
MIILCLGYKSIYICTSLLGLPLGKHARLLKHRNNILNNPLCCQAAQGAKAGVESNNIKDKINFKSFVYNAIKLSLSLMVLANKDISQINRYISSIINLMIMLVTT